MKASSELTFPDTLEATITITAPIKELKMVREQLAECSTKICYPLSEFTKQLNHVIYAVEEKFFANSEEIAEREAE